MKLAAMLFVWTLTNAAGAVFLGARSYPKDPSQNAPAKYGFVDAYAWPYEGRSTHAVTLEPRSQAYRRITVTEERHARFRGWRNAPMVHWTGDSPPNGLDKFTITMQLDTLKGVTAILNVDTKTLGFSYTDPEDATKTVTGKTIDGEQLWGWMIQHGVDMPSPDIRKETDTLADLVTRSVRSGHIGGAPWATGRLERISAQQRDAVPDHIGEYPFATMRGSAQDKYGPAWSIYWLSIPFGLGVFTYGASWILARHRKSRKAT